MKRTGTIKGATIHINYREFGYKAVVSLLINADPDETSVLIEHVEKLPDIYSVYQQGPRGNIRVIATLKNLHQLDEVKDEIKRNFQVSSMKTVIWTDVREMHGNLILSDEEHVTPISKTNFMDLGMRDTKGKESKIDETDLRIAEVLSQDGRAPVAEIAEEVGIPANAVKDRIAKLRQNGKLKITIQIDPPRLGYQALAVFYTTIAPQANSASIVDEITRIPDVISIMKTSGDYDLQIFAMIRNINKLLDIQEKIAKTRGIAKIEMEISGFFGAWPTPRQYMSTF